MKVDIDKVGVPFFSLSLSPPAESLNYHFLEEDTQDKQPALASPRGLFRAGGGGRGGGIGYIPHRGAMEKRASSILSCCDRPQRHHSPSDKDQEAAFSFKVAGTLANFLLSSQYDKRSRIPDMPSLALHFSGVHFLWH